MSLLVDSLSSACPDLSAVFFYECFFICCACSKAADLGLGAAGPGVSEPASDPMPTAASSPPVVPSVDAGAAVDEAAAKDVPAFEEQEISKESDILLQLEGPEIPVGEPILPPPVDCSRFPVARFLHLDETAGPAPQ